MKGKIQLKCLYPELPEAEYCKEGPQLLWGVSCWQTNKRPGATIDTMEIYFYRPYICLLFLAARFSGISLSWLTVWLISCCLVCSLLSPLEVHGIPVVESGTHPWIEMTCSFYFNSSEYNQIDMKWYYNSDDQPFLQWVPSSGRQPQTIGPRFKGRIETHHNLSNYTEVFKTDQVIRVLRPTIHTSGQYTCRVATFTQERATTHSLIVFGTIHLLLITQY